ncbi:MAG: 3-dehydroquinate synthase II [Candidatus Helarchaeota archaeon]
MKKIILRLKGPWEFVKQIASEAIINGLNHFIADSEIIPKIREFGNSHIYSYSDQNAPDFIIKKVSSNGALPENFLPNFGLEMEIKNKDDELYIYKIARKSPDFIIVHALDWMVIPLENLIANLHNFDINLYAEAHSIDEIKLAFEILELGTDGVVFTPDNVNDISKIKDLIKSKISLQLSVAKVIEKKEVGTGDRVCIDTCSLLKPGEGMLIGSQSRGMFLIHGETIETEFVASRPFRVNAGSVSAYILLPNGKTQYLSEIETGSEVLIVNSDGSCRTAIVGRSKIESRPMMLIKAQINNDTLKTIVQNAETIRLVSKDGTPISISKLQPNDEILVYYTAGGRHFGTLINETIIEK